MTKKVLVTTYVLIRELENNDPSGPLWPAVRMLRQAGVEPVLCGKGEHGYDAGILRDIAPGCGAAIIGSEKWGADKMDLCPDLKCLSRFGVGYDAVDLAAAKERRIMVTNARVPESARSVAECALALLLNCARRFMPSHLSLRNGEWSPRSGRQLYGKTVGLIGFGAIGRAFAGLLSGFGTRILAVDPFPDKTAAADLDVALTDLDTLLAESDVVSLHAPNTPENRHMVDADFIAKMKEGVIFINTARGAMVDEAALTEGLRRGKPTAAGLDVFEKEPTPSDNPLLVLENVVAFPHMAAETDESALAVANCTVRQAIAALNGQLPEYLLNA